MGELTGQLYVTRARVGPWRQVCALPRYPAPCRDRLEDSIVNFAVNDEVVLYHARECAPVDGDVDELVSAISGG